MSDASSSKNQRVLITHCEVPQEALQLLVNEKYEIDICTELPYPSRNDILKRINGVDALFWVSKEKMDKEIMDAAGNGLRVVCTMSAGHDNIDLEEARSRGVKVGNTPNVLTASVAEMAIALMLEVARRIPEGRTCITQNRWEIIRPQWMLGKDIVGSTIGIVGLGGIGQAIAKRIKAFEISRLLYCGNNKKTEGDSLGAEFVTYEKLLSESDFVIIACPLNRYTKHMFNDKSIALMKSSAILINIARGDIIDQDALIRALEKGVIWGAGLDVMTPEPLPSTHPLLKLKNCVLSPHLGSATENTRNAMAVLTARNIIAALNGEPMLAPLV